MRHELLTATLLAATMVPGGQADEPDPEKQVAATAQAVGQRDDRLAGLFVETIRWIFAADHAATFLGRAEDFRTSLGLGPHFRPPEGTLISLRRLSLFIYARRDSNPQPTVPKAVARK